MTGSKYLLYVSGLCAIAFALAAPSAKAQEAEHNVCLNVVSHDPEPLGDRQGHAIQSQLNACRTSDGPLAGSVMNVNVLWEWDGTKANQLSLQGYYRKPGAVVAFQGTDGKVELTMTDGKVTGATAAGHVIVTMATGSAASLQGKSGVWTAKNTGPDSFDLEVTYK